MTHPELTLEDPRITVYVHTVAPPILVEGAGIHMVTERLFVWGYLQNCKFLARAVPIPHRGLTAPRRWGRWCTTVPQ